MKTLKTILWVAACVVTLGLGAGQVQAQGRGNYDPAQFRADMINRYKDSMEVKDEGEWKLIEAAIGKVFDAQREVLTSRMGGFVGGRRSRSGSTNSPAGGTSGSSNSQRGSRFGGTPSPEAEDLQKAIDDKAPADQIKAKLAKLREVNAAKEAKLTAAQEELKAMLTARQEAIAVTGGLLR